VPEPADAPWWGRNVILGLLMTVLMCGWIVIALLPRVSGTRKSRFIMWGVLLWAAFFGVTLFSTAAERQDTWGMLVVGYVGFALAAGLYGGWRARGRLGIESSIEENSTATAGVPPGGALAAATPSASLAVVETPGSLPNFRNVGGMEDLKKELRDTIGLLLAYSDKASAYNITWNGVLLHGPPGVGKTFIAQATAGEFGMNLVRVNVGDLVSAYRGESARNVDAVFGIAAQNLPAVLFFDEFDSIAIRRDNNFDDEGRRTVNALLQALERSRDLHELVVMAATNAVDSLDPAVIRAGRFDRQINVPLPDTAARRSILATQIHGLPGEADIDLDELAERTEAMTPAVLSQIVRSASLTALRDSTAREHTGGLVPLTTDRLVTALRDRGGKDRPTVEHWNWDRLILPPKVLAELKEVARLVREPDRAAEYGVEPPSGVLLHGPPGTGKTTVARVLAAEANCSFYPATAADLTSMWLGESERLIAQLFDRARENQPSIIFLDEIDAIASRRGEGTSYDAQVNQLLQEIDGMQSTRGVLVVAATNRKDRLDPALLRGGRLSRHIEIGLPDKDARRKMLDLFTADMPLDRVDLDQLAATTNTLSGADLEALCQTAAVNAMIRGGDHPAVTSADFATAILEHKGLRKVGEERRVDNIGHDGYM
jgi:transitional endoplasmic reticulum ATPase